MDQFISISNTSTLYLALAFSAREDLPSIAVGVAILLFAVVAIYCKVTSGVHFTIHNAYFFIA